jgi:hypothetical protein
MVKSKRTYVSLKEHGHDMSYGRTLNQTIRDARESKAAKHNPYLDDEDMVENKYYQFKGAW